MELLRSMIDHKKIVVLALNGPAIGAGGAWFAGVADIVLASDKTYLQIPFSALGLVPENGSAITFAQSMGVHRANEFLMFGTKLSVEELEKYGVVNKVFPTDGFHGHVKKYLEEHLKDKDAKSMIEVKRLQNASFRDQRIVAVFNSVDALAERFVEGAPFDRFKSKMQELEGTFISLTYLSMWC
jgi:peroxisomal 3,2-trans-enoyl-CoA isomerase